MEITLKMIHYNKQETRLRDLSTLMLAFLENSRNVILYVETSVIIPVEEGQCDRCL